MIEIRPEQPGDADPVREIHRLAFSRPDEARLVDRLRHSDGAISIVACDGGLVVGHVFFTPVTIDPPRGDAPTAGLAPVAVRPDRQRRGVGGALVRKGLAACRDHGYAAVVVLGDPHYYSRFGFVPAAARRLAYERPVPPEAFMIVELTRVALSGPPAVVRYLPEFADV